MEIQAADSGLILSRSLASMQGKILGAAPYVRYPLTLFNPRFASLPRFSLESGCKGTHFSEFRKPHAEIFSRFFCNRIVTRWKAGI